MRRPPAAVDNSHPDINPAEFHLPNLGNCLNNRGHLSLQARYGGFYHCG
jgi:hypothetical protein